MRLLLLGLLCLPVMAMLGPSLAATFRRRLRYLLDTQRIRQVAAAKAVGLSQARISKILKHDAEAATVTVERLAKFAELFGLSPAELVRGPEDTAVTLTRPEAEFLGMFRRLPPEQQQTLSGWLDFVFGQRDDVIRQRKAVEMLRRHVGRQIEESAQGGRRPAR